MSSSLVGSGGDSRFIQTLNRKPPPASRKNRRANRAVNLGSYFRTFAAGG
ncbi:MAG: hypothetical protein ACREEM_55635 [Blastocatellia bacterium]